MRKFFVKVSVPSANGYTCREGLVEVWACDVMDAIALAGHIIRADGELICVVGAAERFEDIA